MKFLFSIQITKTRKSFSVSQTSFLRYSGKIEAKGTLRKGFLPPRWRLLIAQIIQCLGGKTDGYDQITNKDAIILYCLANAVNIDYARLIWEDILAKMKKAKRERVVPYPRFLSLLLEHKMEGYGDDEVTLNLTQIFSNHNWVLKNNQPEGPPFNAHTLAICSADEPVTFEAPNTSSYNRKKDSKGKKFGATAGHIRKQTSSTTKHNLGYKIEATKGGPSTKETTGSKTGHFKKKKSSSAKDLNPSQTPASTSVVTGLHKEVQHKEPTLSSEV
ncbi:hypothetical protein Tco_0861483 [Tanacetum coccineum]|uniref:Uncharacterized protein n=1 Tax=Tanacetum coccineum TaxID=301880 RepID=A0ABQ5BID0_9ASTR